METQEANEYMKDYVKNVLDRAISVGKGLKLTPEQVLLVFQEEANA